MNGPSPTPPGANCREPDERVFARVAERVSDRVLLWDLLAAADDDTNRIASDPPSRTANLGAEVLRRMLSAPGLPYVPDIPAAFLELLRGER